MAVTAEDFIAALRALPEDKLKEQRRRMLQAHYEAPGRAATATQLADAAGYESYRGTNSSYGYLASAISNALELPEAGLGLLCDFAKPNTLTNREWILMMKTEFAEALLSEGIVVKV